MIIHKIRELFRIFGISTGSNILTGHTCNCFKEVILDMRAALTCTRFGVFALAAYVLVRIKQYHIHVR